MKSWPACVRVVVSSFWNVKLHLCSKGIIGNEVLASLCESSLSSFWNVRLHLCSKGITGNEVLATLGESSLSSFWNIKLHLSSKGITGNEVLASLCESSLSSFWNALLHLRSKGITGNEVLASLCECSLSSFGWWQTQVATLDACFRHYGLFFRFDGICSFGISLWREFPVMGFVLMRFHCDRPTPWRGVSWCVLMFAVVSAARARCETM